MCHRCGRPTPGVRAAQTWTRRRLGRVAQLCAACLLAIEAVGPSLFGAGFMSGDELLGYGDRFVYNATASGSNTDYLYADDDIPGLDEPNEQAIVLHHEPWTRPVILKGDSVEPWRIHIGSTDPEKDEAR